MKITDDDAAFILGKGGKTKDPLAKQYAAEQHALACRQLPQPVCRQAIKHGAKCWLACCHT
eukprot:6042649-Amphidinium_carterae.1